MPQIPSSDINEMLQYPDENGLTDIKLIWNREEDGLPVNFQEGTTCGIYALHAATKVLNKHYAPPTTQETGAKNGKKEVLFRRNVRLPFAQ